MNMYLKNNILLINTLIVKLYDIGRIMENKVAKVYNLPIPTDKIEWKYFMNLAGIKHHSNTDIKITLIETSETVSLTKEILLEYPETHDELKLMTEYYQELVLNYLDDVILIKGIIYPADINEAIEAKDGQILTYNKDLIEPQELNVVYQLNQFSLNYMHRWYFTEFSYTDKMYTHIAMADLFSKLVMKLRNIRIDNLHSSKAHSFFVSEFFNSNLNIDKFTKDLNPESKLWLYRHLKYITHNVGKNKIFTDLHENLLTPNGIIVTKTIVGESEMVIDKEHSDSSTDAYSLDNVVIKDIDPIDNSITKSHSTRDAVDELVVLDTVSKDKIITDYEVNLLDSVLATKYCTKEYTKIIKLGTLSNYNLSQVNTMELLINNFIYDTLINNYESTSILPSVTNNDFTILTGVDVAKYLFNMLGYDNSKHNKVELSSVITLDTNHILDLHLTQDIKNYLIIRINTLSRIKARVSTKDSYITYLKSMIEYFNQLSLILSNCNDISTKTAMRVYLSRLLSTKSIDYDLDVSSYTVNNVYDFTSEICTLFVGIVHDDKIPLMEKVNSYIQLMTRLSSYSVTYIPTDNIEDLTINSTSATISNYSTGMCEVREVGTKGLLEKFDDTYYCNGLVNPDKITLLPTLDSLEIDIEDSSLPVGIYKVVDEVDILRNTFYITLDTTMLTTNIPILSLGYDLIDGVDVLPSNVEVRDIDYIIDNPDVSVLYSVPEDSTAEVIKLSDNVDTYTVVID